MSGFPVPYGRHPLPMKPGYPLTPSPAEGERGNCSRHGGDSNRKGGVLPTLTLLVAILLPPSLTGAEPGFESLFNGHDLTGWDGNPKLWSVKDGAITGQTTVENPAPGNTFLIWTNGTVADFELRCSFRLVPGDSKGFANSGVQYRSKILDPANWVVGGYQADMEAGPNYTGILYEERMSRQIMAQRGEKVIWGKDCQKQVVGSVGSAAEIEASLKKGDWNDYVIIAQGNHLRQWVNGKQTIDVTDECESKRAMSGVLALQLHAGSPMMAQFKNIRIKTLSGQAHAQGEDLDQMQGTWKVASGEADGAPVSNDYITGFTVNINGTSYVLHDVRGDRSGTFTIDPSKQPKQIDIQPGGQDESRKMLGIYEVGPAGMRICYARAGDPRPATFSTEQDSGRLLVSYVKDVKKVVFIAGPPSHGPREHEHRAGCLLLKSCLDNCAGVTSVVYSNGWPQDPNQAFANVATVVVYSDGGGGHPLLQDDRLNVFGDLMRRGIGLVCIHYAVEPTKEKGEKEFLDWLGGCFEVNRSVNPTWMAYFKSLPDHPITRGVHPFRIFDEWYFYMRFRNGMTGITPILTSIPPESTMKRPDGPHEGNPEVRAAVKRQEPQHTAWAFERQDGGRAFGFTGAHFHKNWGNDDFRKLVLNAILWTAKVEVPPEGVASKVSEADLERNLDSK